MRKVLSKLLSRDVKKKDWNKLVMYTAMHIYIPKSLWCVTQERIIFRPSFIKSGIILIVVELHIKVK